MEARIKIRIEDLFFDSNSRLFQVCLILTGGQCLVWTGEGFNSAEFNRADAFVNLTFIKRENVRSEYLKAVAAANDQNFAGRMVLIDLQNPEDVYCGRH